MIRIEWFPPRYNIAPTQPVLVIRSDRGERQAVLMRWGLVPGWAKDLSELPLLFNARSETAPSKPAFRGPFRNRRCLVPASGFYEWRKDPDGGRQPFYLRPHAGKVFALAGLWDEWADAQGNMLDSVTILTTGATPDIAVIHDRMPVVVERQDYDRWLGMPGGEGVVDILRAPPEGFFEAVPVDSRIGNFRNDDPAIQKPAPDRLKGAAAPARRERDAQPDAAELPPKQLKLL